MGNPGEKYRATRHNMGFLLLELLAEKYSLTWAKPAREYSLCEYELGDMPMVFLKPTTYMNLSGDALQAFSARESFEPGELLVLCDDFALSLGRLRLRKRGSDGGHNGLRSIIDALGSEDFPRLRIGIGPVPEGMDPAEFVLQPFLEEEKGLVADAVHRAADCFETLVREGFDRAMGEFNAPSTSAEND
ncbi:MAG: aminoacyl-tRNA hydrolase [Candidatus Latescibacteria bacterium]|nr:aminoacyl-tRNA hydrolase [Candidatus Latescibacterota bacterium]NIM21121.1 aminoacyl-tRNA hydrolase [Candidatus Latescibacterota bacterium]NIM65256.1 aminoacyl-tRNA hydrolase [Candidatus Latescibacterota bacterium]NIO01771.1 aminoacyl-tRNA hydrolase [Candidatus Latescibacterota bacterium]NIO28288.1 aminoacyl-tRNA hydrolase [Candidatus Latescibacterota bacterium]